MYVSVKIEKAKKERLERSWLHSFYGKALK
jgi:hypothetical protein